MNTEIANSSVKSKIYKWEVVSNKMENTLVVKVTSVKSHPLYKKRYSSFKKYYVHNENSEVKIGDIVSFVETKPMSKMKRWIIVSN